ncbi:MAG: hypothetical protein ABIQ11_05320, partial [Saprospiraceae bacterium]
MKYNPRIHHRRSMRLSGYDYAQVGSYYVTLNCSNRTHLFGRVIAGKMHLNQFGMIAYNEWIKTSVIRSNIQLGPFVIMPDHIHGIIRIASKASE